MNDNWAANEFKLLNRWDERLKKRISIMAENFFKSPESTINQASGSWADTKAAYRFFNNDSIQAKDITDSHANSTKHRCNDYQTILAIQDTSYFNYTKHPNTKGLCILTSHKGLSTKEIQTFGLVMHTALAVSTDGLPLGIISQSIYSRDESSQKVTESEKHSAGKKLPIEARESFRWLEFLKQTNVVFKDHPAKIVTVADREADIYQLFKLAADLKENVLVRAGYNRKVNKKSPGSKVTGVNLWELLRSKKSIGTIEIKVPKQKDRAERVAKCSIQLSKFDLTPPQKLDGSAQLPVLEMYAIYLSEEKIAEDIDPIEWMLLTNIPTTNPDQAIEKIEWYCLRWKIETFHKVLKSGLKVENCRLSNDDRLIRYLSVMSVVAWRIFYITLIARVAPDISCTVLFNNIDWKILDRKYNKQKEKQKRPPSLNKFITWIAMLGGYLNRKSDPDPGITYIWRGLKKLANMLEGIELMKDIYG